MQFSRQTGQALKAAHETGHTFEPRYPDGTAIGATISVRGPDSQAVRTLLRRQIAEQHERNLRARKARGEPEPMSIEQIEAESIDLAVAYTIRWDGFVDAGQPMEPTEANFRAIYAECPWIRRQVIDEAQDLGNFVRPPSASCSSTPTPSSSLT